jgi:ribA/ribD-fused uncharacterized protein
MSSIGAVTMKTIDKFSGEYRWLSNFWPCSIEYEGIVYPSVENAYQAAKTTDLEIRQEFVFMSPFVAKEEGRKLRIRLDWERIKVQTMFRLVTFKFSNNENLMWKLIMTHNADIIEGNTWGDTFWGQCNKQGKNELGLILMAVRHDLTMKHCNDQVVINRVGMLKFYDEEDYGGAVDEEMCKEPL